MLDQLSVERGMTVMLMPATSDLLLLLVVMVTELSEKLDGEVREAKVAQQLMKEQNDDLRHKMSFFIRVSSTGAVILTVCVCVHVHVRVCVCCSVCVCGIHDNDNNNNIVVGEHRRLE